MFDNKRRTFSIVAMITFTLGLSLKTALPESPVEKPYSDWQKAGIKYVAGKLIDSGFKPYARRRLINADVYTATVFSTDTTEGNCAGDVLLLDLPRNEEVKALLSSIVSKGGGDVTYLLNGVPFKTFPTFPAFLEGRRATLKRALGMKASFSHVAVASETACDSLHDKLRLTKR